LWLLFSPVADKAVVGPLHKADLVHSMLCRTQNILYLKKLREASIPNIQGPVPSPKEDDSTH